MLRPRLQRLVERVNASPLPVVVELARARTGMVARWELRVRTPAKPFAAWRVPLSPWRRCPPVVVDELRRRRGARALPFQEERVRTTGPGGVQIFDVERLGREALEDLRRRNAV